MQQAIALDIDIDGGASHAPARQQRREAEARQADAVSAIESNPNVKAIQKTFDATLHAESIRPLDSH